MTEHRISGTRHAPGMPNDTATEHVAPKHTPKRRKTNQHLRADAASCAAAAAALLIALAVVAPHLADDTAPKPADWAILTLALALLVVLGLKANRRL